MNAARFSSANLQSATQGHWLNQAMVPESTQALTLNTDTRSIKPGQCFVAIQGERFDGHQYVQQAFESGADAAIVSDAWVQGQGTAFQAPGPLLLVKDTLLAYLALGRFWRDYCGNENSALQVVGLTGSSGKTTVKDLLCAAISPNLTTQATQLNHNNDIGVTQTLLSLEANTQCLIVEMGMRGLGEIERLAVHAKPDVGILINVGPAHIGRLGSLEAIAQAKCELVKGLHPEQGMLIANGDDPLLRKRLGQDWPKDEQTQWFGLGQAVGLEALPNGCYRFSYQDQGFETRLPGLHQVSNWLLVIQTAQRLGLSLASIARNLYGYQANGEQGRWQQVELQNESYLVNDAYNANPASMQASIEAFLQQCPWGTKPVLVLAGMKELGELSDRYHQDLGRWLSVQPLEALVLVGNEMVALEAGLNENRASYSVQRMSDAEPTLEKITSVLEVMGCLPPTKTAFLLKGSRAYGLDALAHKLKASFSDVALSAAASASAS